MHLVTSIIASYHFYVADDFSCLLLYAKLEAIIIIDLKHRFKVKGWNNEQNFS